MADTLTVDIVDLTVRPLNPVNIAIINKPNPVSGYAATGEQLIKLIQISNYSIKETATGIPVTGKNIYEYFPDLDPGGGGGGGGGDSYTKAETNALLEQKADASTVVTNVAFDSTNGKFTETINNTSSDIIVLDTDPTTSSKKPVTSGGINTAINSLDASFIEVTPTEILTMWNYSSYIKTYIDYDDLANCKIVSGDPNSQKAYKNRRRCNLADNGTVNAYYGDPSYIEDGSNGQVMVEQPRFYYKVEPVELDGAAIKKCYYYFSDYPVQGFKLHPFFKNEAGKVVDHAFFSAYEGSLYSASLGQILGWDDKLAYDSATTTAADFTTDKLCSVAGVQPISGNTHNLIIENAEKLATNRGAGWHIENIFAASANQMMFIIEYASANSQTVIGDGVTNIQDLPKTTNNSSLTGSTTLLGNGSGNATSTIDHTNTAQTESDKVAVSFRGVENPFGNIFKYILGFNTVFSNNTVKGYIANNYSFRYEDVTGYGELGFNIANPAEYVKYFGYSELFDWVFIPTIMSYTPITTIGDRLSPPSSIGTRTVRLGGAWTGGSGAGLFWWYMVKPTSDRSRLCSARLCYVPQN